MHVLIFFSRCPEYDTLESNKHIVTGALHNCEWGGDWFTGCDMGGCGSSSWVGGVPYGPGQMINSDNEFWISHYQNNDIANTYMEQNGNGAAFNLCDQGWYMPVMGNHYPSMVFSMSLWGIISQEIIKSYKCFISKVVLMLTWAGWTALLGVVDPAIWEGPQSQ